MNSTPATEAHRDFLAKNAESSSSPSPFSPKLWREHGDGQGANDRRAYLVPPQTGAGALTREQSAEKLALWRKALCLFEWRFSLVFEMPDRFHQAGEINRRPESREAVITLCESSDPSWRASGGARVWPPTPEETIVHELVHAMLADMAMLTSIDERLRAEEIVVERLVRTFFRLLAAGSLEEAAALASA